MIAGWIAIATIIVGLGGATLLARIRARALRLAAVAIWLVLPLLVMLAMWASAGCFGGDHRGGCVGIGFLFAALMSTFIPVWMIASGIGLIIAKRRRSTR